MSTYLFDIEAEATDADVDTDHEYSLDDISEDTSCDDENVDEVKPMPLLDKDFLEHPEASVIKYCRGMKGSCSTASDGTYDCDLSDSYDGDDEDGEDSDWEEGVEFNGGEDNDDRSESAESSKDDWLERRKARPSSARKRSLFQVYLKQDSSYDSAEPESISTTPMKKRTRIYLDDDKDEEA
jgi:hypothetical protein